MGTAFNPGVRVRVLSGVYAGVNGTVVEYMDEFDYPKVRVRLDKGTDDLGVDQIFYPSSLGVLADIIREENRQIEKLTWALIEATGREAKWAVELAGRLYWEFDVRVERDT
jgi:hypothetical protein